tara:strand:- start:242 stop:469 length:228 start_codon:yes stop_codon:yes gene_type:complete
VEKMIETVFALLMIVNHEIKEHRIQDSLSICLKHKREATREVNIKDNIQYKCIKSKAELEKNIDGSITIKKLILK